jgi:hypothetical protein
MLFSTAKIVFNYLIASWRTVARLCTGEDPVIAEWRFEKHSKNLRRRDGVARLAEALTELQAAGMKSGYTVTVLVSVDGRSFQVCLDLRG